MTSLAHVNIRTSRLDDSIAFYRDVIGLVPGGAATRPGSTNHVWMSDDEGRPCVHLQRTAGDEDSGSGDQIGVHHVAFECIDPQSWRDKLAAHRIAFTETPFPDAKLLQINLIDPNEVRLELLFASNA